MTKHIVLFFCVCWAIAANAQTNMKVSNPTFDNILKGNYKFSDYQPANIISAKEDIVNDLVNQVSADSLKLYLVKLGSFETRNTGSDTISTNRGIGAARRWVLSKFNQFSQKNENRLVTSYLYFEDDICGITKHKNVMAILPGSDVSNHEIIIIEAHMDSRCEMGCDTSCLAQGIDDNGSGTVLVMELARAMSKYVFDKTILFVTTTGEEQGLLGAYALAKYASDNDLPVKAVLNNDLVGGIICGETSSAPGCLGEGSIDSTSVRLFSYGNFNSPYKSLARYTKLQFEEELAGKISEMQIRIMNMEDRTGRGGDHIPFRLEGFPAIRFTEANENGDGHPDSAYTDRQHSVRDILGLDTDHDGKIDSFFVDFNYLKRNTLINGVTAAMIAKSPETPEFKVTNDEKGLHVKITSQLDYNHYRIGVRTIKSNYFINAYSLENNYDYNIPGIQKDTFYAVSVASVNDEGIESLFSDEQLEIAKGNSSGIHENGQSSKLKLLPVAQNPYDETVVISIYKGQSVHMENATLRIKDITGKILESKNLNLKDGLNQVTYYHGYHASGIYLITLQAKGFEKQVEKLVLK